MERTLSVEEKIRRAEEIYARRHEVDLKRTATVNVNNRDNRENKKDIRLLKKMVVQIIICLFIYISIYMIENNNYIFSEDFMNKANEILSYDTNFKQIYENIKNQIIVWQNDNNDGAIGGASLSDIKENEINVENKNNEVNENISIEENVQEENLSKENVNKEEKVVILSQEEQDIINIKNTTTFIKPVQGNISSKYGLREPTTSTVPKNHTGTDIAANLGTKILSATGGEVVLASEEGDYGKHLKIKIGDVSIIYAHCNNLYVKQGDIVTQGQEIAEVGSTGNSTGPHLHFEIRISERTVDPQKILEL